MTVMLLIGEQRNKMYAPKQTRLEAELPPWNVLVFLAFRNHCSETIRIQSMPLTALLFENVDSPQVGPVSLFSMRRFSVGEKPVGLCCSRNDLCSNAGLRKTAVGAC